MVLILVHQVLQEFEQQVLILTLDLVMLLVEAEVVADNQAETQLELLAAPVAIMEAVEAVGMFILHTVVSLQPVVGLD